MRATAVSLLLLCCACEPTVQLPARVYAVVMNKSNKLEQREVQLTTPTSVVHFTGPLLTLVGGAQVVVDPSDPALGSAVDDKQIEEVLLKNRGNSVRASYLDKGGALVPTDFHTWGMTTTYYNFEQAFLYFQKLYDGKPTDEIKNIRVFYWGSYRDYGTNSEKDVVDNAIFFSPIKSFMVLPFEKLQRVPLSLNLGVVGHEFAHLVFNKKVYKGAALPPPISAWTLAPFNLLKSMDEGIADFHGYSLTCVTSSNLPGCDSQFLALSFDKTNPDDARLIAERALEDDAKCMTSELRNAFNNFQPNNFLNAGLHYKVGSLISTALYQAAVPLAKEDILQKALIAALDDESASTPGFRQFISQNQETPQAFSPEVMTNIIASHITDLQLKNAVCKQLWDHLDLDSSKFPSAELPACQSATRGMKCPVLPQ